MDELMQLSLLVLGSASKSPGGKVGGSQWMDPQDAFLSENNKS